MDTRARVSLIAAAAAALLACSDTPTGLQSIRSTPDDAAPQDTTSTLPGTVQVSGRILGVSAADPVSGPGDTLRFEPIARASIEVVRNVLVNGAAQQVLAATLASGAEGEYRIADLPGGYYIVRATPPTGSAYAANWEYLPATKPEVRVDVYLWRR